MANFEIIKGTDRSITVVCNNNSVPVDLTGYTVTASLRDRNSTATANGATVTCSSGDTGARFSAGIIVATWTDTQTDAMTVGQFQLEVKTVDGSGNITKYIPDEIIEVRDSVT